MVSLKRYFVEAGSVKVRIKYKSYSGRAWQTSTERWPLAAAEEFVRATNSRAKVHPGMLRDAELAQFWYCVVLGRGEVAVECGGDEE